MNNSSHIAILFFSRTAENEALAKKWVNRKSKESNKRIANLLIRNTEKALSKSGLPVYRFDETMQTARSFGENISQAYEKVFAMGYSSVIAIGNDHATIQNIKWDYIKKMLSSGKSIVGASIRGGAYLIGIQKRSFHKETFLQLPWQTNKLFSALYKVLKKESDISLLSPERDINTYHDIIKYIKEATPNNHLVRPLLLLLRDITTICTAFRSNHICLFTNSFHSLRAPPLALLTQI
ncbi:MAG: hypothetical protein ACJAT1_001323 [Marivirga sp.]